MFAQPGLGPAFFVELSRWGSRIERRRGAALQISKSPDKGGSVWRRAETGAGPGCSLAGLGEFGADEQSWNIFAAGLGRSDAVALRIDVVVVGGRICRQHSVWFAFRPAMAGLGKEAVAGCAGVFLAFELLGKCVEPGVCVASR